MPKRGDTFVIELKRAHLEWGSYRHTNTREIIYGEGYIQIPRKHAIQFGIYNNNYPYANPNYVCSTNDGFLKNAKVIATGSTVKGDMYAKQFQGSGNLKLFGNWFEYVSAQQGDQVKVTWLSEDEILLELV